MEVESLMKQSLNMKREAVELVIRYLVLGGVNTHCAKQLMVDAVGGGKIGGDRTCVQIAKLSIFFPHVSILIS